MHPAELVGSKESLKKTETRTGRMILSNKKPSSPLNRQEMGLVYQLDKFLSNLPMIRDQECQGTET